MGWLRGKKIARAIAIFVALLTVTAAVGPAVVVGSIGNDAGVGNDVGVGNDGPTVDDVGSADTRNDDGPSTDERRFDVNEINGTARLIVRFNRTRSSVTATSNGQVSTDDLERHANDSQVDFESFADRRAGVEIERRFWIANAMLIEVDTDRVPIDRLLDVHGVERVHENFEIAIDTASAGTASAGTASAGTTSAGTTSAGTTRSGGVGADEAGADAAVGTEPVMELRAGPRVASNGANATATTGGGSTTYGVEMVRAQSVWETFGTRGGNATVAVLDTGIDPNHQDLTVDAWAEFDANGNLVSDDLDNASDVDGHGTHVAGTVAGGNASGTAIGVAPEAELYGIKVLDDTGVGSFAQVIAGMERASNNASVDVIQMSLGSTGQVEDLIEPVQNARSSGKIVVASAGNDGDGASSSPGNVYESFAVGAVDSNRDVASFSSGETLNSSTDWDNKTLTSGWPDEYVVPDAAAPGVGVESAETGTTSGTTSKSGTSMAAPHVSGIAALVISSRRTAIDDADLYDAIRNTTDHPDDATDPDTRYGTGVVDGFAATAAATDYAAASVVNDAPTYVEANDTYRAKLRVANAENYTPTLATSEYLSAANVTVSVAEVGTSGTTVAVGNALNLSDVDGDTITVEVTPASDAVGRFALDHGIGGPNGTSANVTTATTRTHPDPLVHPAVTPDALNGSIGDVLNYTAANATVQLEAGTYDERVNASSAALTVNAGRTLDSVPSPSTTPTVNVTDDGPAVAVGDGGTIRGIALDRGGVVVNGSADGAVTNVTVTNTSDGLSVVNATNTTATGVTLDGAGDVVTVTDGTTGTTVDANVTAENATVRFGGVAPDTNSVTVDLANGRVVEAGGRNATLSNGTDPEVGPTPHEPIGAFLELNGTATDANLSVDVEYAETELDGLREETAELFRVNVTADEIESVASGSVDVGNDTVEGTVTSFSTFGVYAETTRTLNGTVTDAESGGPISGVTVAAERNGTPAGEATTGTNGTYTTDVLTGDLTVTAGANTGSYANGTGTVTVNTSDDTKTLNLSLTPTPDFVVDTLNGPAEISQDGSGEFDVTVRNDGAAAGDATVTFSVEGAGDQSAGVSNVSVGGKQTTTFTHSVASDDATGTYDVSASVGDDASSTTFDVVEAATEETDGDDGGGGGGGGGGSGGGGGGGGGGFAPQPDESENDSEAAEDPNADADTPVESTDPDGEADPEGTDETAGQDGTDGTDSAGGSGDTDDTAGSEGPQDPEESADGTAPPDDAAGGEVPGFGPLTAMAALFAAALLVRRRHRGG